MSHKDISPSQDYIPANNHQLHESNEVHFSHRLTGSVSVGNGDPYLQQRAHLVLNNFITSSSPKKTILTNNYSNQHQSNHQYFHQHNESPSNGGESVNQNTHSNFLYVYFFFAYYLCLTPFRLKKVKSPVHQNVSTFEIHEYLPQKILCAISNVLALTRYAVEFRKCVETITKNNPITFFKLFESSSSLVFKTVILRCFWYNKGKFLHIARFLESPLILPYNKLKMQSIITVSALCSFYVIIGFARIFMGSGFLRPSSLTPSWWARRLVAEGRYSFFLANESHFDSAPDHHEISPLDTFLAIVTGFTFQCRFIAGYFVDVGILLCVLSLWAPVAGFAASLKKQLKNRLQTEFDNYGYDYINGESRRSSEFLNKLSPSHEIEYVQAEITRQELVIKQYKALKKLTEMISEANGPTILPFISEAIFGYALFFEDVLITPDISHKIILICFYFCAVNILVFSADICRKMQIMKSWLWDEERLSCFPHQKLMLILHDLSSNTVGITASGIFTVDFYIVGSMISVLITLFIIRLQYQTLDV